MNIVYSSDDNYVRHLATSLYSLLDSNQSENEITIYILNVGLSEENIEKIKSVAEKFGREIIFIDFSNIKDRLNKTDVPVNSLSIETYSRLFMAEALPDTADRAMWIDGDTVVLGSIHDMYYCDMSENAIAAVADQPNFSMDILRKDVGLKNGPYYNAGVFIANLNAWRNENISKKFVETFLSRETGFLFLDQSVLNKTLAGKIYTLPTKYNVVFPTFILSYQRMLQSWGEALYTESEYNEAKKHPIIIHYTNYRPWKLWCVHPKKKYYRKYLKKTPYKDVPLENDGLFTLLKQLFISVKAKVKAILHH